MKSDSIMLAGWLTS